MPSPAAALLLPTVAQEPILGLAMAAQQSGSHINREASLALIRARQPWPQHLGREVLQEAIGPALHPMWMLMDVTGAGVARRQHPPPRALHSQRGSAPVT